MVAYEKAKILHRDVSSGNILISENGEEGFLIDWDFSKEIDQTSEAPRQPERTVSRAVTFSRYCLLIEL